MQQDFESTNDDFQSDLADLATRTQNVKVSFQYVSALKLGKLKNIRSKLCKALFNTLNDSSLVFIDSDQNIARLRNPAKKKKTKKKTKKKPKREDTESEKSEPSSSQSGFQSASPAKKQRKILLAHSTYLFPADATAMSWRATLLLAEKFKGVFVFRKPKLSDRLKATISEKPETLHPNDETFATYCSGENALLSRDQPKQWKVLDNNEQFCSMLMVHSGSLFLDELSRAVEDDCARIMLEYLKIPGQLSSESSPTKKLRTAKAGLG